jgi:hypothetical protein
VTEKTLRAVLPAEKDIADRIQVWRHRQILIDRFNAKLSRLVWRGKLHRRAIEVNLTGFEGNDACQHVDQCRFARSVVADKGNDFAWVNREIDILQGVNGTKVLVDPARLEYWPRCRDRARRGH